MQSGEACFLAALFQCYNLFTHFRLKCAIIIIIMYKKGVGFVDPLPRSWPEEGTFALIIPTYNMPVCPSYGAVAHKLLC